MNRPNKQDYPVSPMDEPIVEFKKYTDDLEKYADELERKLGECARKIKRLEIKYDCSINKMIDAGCCAIEVFGKEWPCEETTCNTCLKLMINDYLGIRNERGK